jgi:REP element-mobilizing transposase RayT
VSSYPTRKRQRLAAFDYTTAGYYAVTICVQERLPLFGRVIDGEVHHAPAGTAIEDCLQEIPGRFPGVVVDTVMVMPDHLHVLLVLDGESVSLSEIIHWFKSQSTSRYARGVQREGWPRFAGTLWQRGFYERVIRTEEDLNTVRAYMLTNPQRWMLRDEQR